MSEGHNTFQFEYKYHRTKPCKVQVEVILLILTNYSELMIAKELVSPKLPQLVMRETTRQKYTYGEIRK